jgi:hypothetical protein
MRKEFRALLPWWAASVGALLLSWMLRTSALAPFIDDLGGTFAAARIFRVTPPAVSNWKAANAMPARLHLRAIREAASRGIAFDPEAPTKAKRRAV